VAVEGVFSANKPNRLARCIAQETIDMDLSTDSETGPSPKEKVAPEFVERERPYDENLGATTLRTNYMKLQLSPSKLAARC